MTINWVVLDPPERKRTYRFPTCEISFDNVIRIEVRDSGKHRIETAVEGEEELGREQ